MGPMSLMGLMGLIWPNTPDARHSTAPTSSRYNRPMTDRYVPAEFEAKWQARWAAADLFKTRTAEGAPKFYGLEFFPYPSGAGLSVGHCRNYIPPDVICRLKLMQGYNVLHPMGFDAFGLPAENEAIKTHTHPRPMIDRYAATYKRQMDLVGISYDWSREFKSSDPTFYRWTQWIFELLYKRGLAYRKLAAVNWDPVDKTVLADEEIIGGRAERSGALVEKRFIPQWFFKITDYAQRLIDDLDDVDWPEGIKSQQRNWIGRSEGVQFRIPVRAAGSPASSGDSAEFVVVGHRKDLSFDVFTTRVDTVFGMTFCVLAPEHALLDSILERVDAAHAQSVRDYQAAARRLSDTDRLATTQRRPAFSRALTPRTRPTARPFRFGSRTTFWPPTEPAPSWPCPGTTIATSNSPPSLGSTSRRSSRRLPIPSLSCRLSPKTEC